VPSGNIAWARAQAADLLLVRGDDELAANFMRDAMLLAERHYAADALDGEARLERTGFVVEPGVEHAAVVRALMLADLRFLFEQLDAGLRRTTLELERRAHADQTAPMTA
jgi:hypothetical protein